MLRDIAVLTGGEGAGALFTQRYGRCRLVQSNRLPACTPSSVSHLDDTTICRGNDARAAQARIGLGAIDRDGQRPRSAFGWQLTSPPASAPQCRAASLRRSPKPGP